MPESHLRPVFCTFCANKQQMEPTSVRKANLAVGGGSVHVFRCPVCGSVAALPMSSPHDAVETQPALREDSGALM
jgi:hypothetical protein